MTSGEDFDLRRRFVPVPNGQSASGPLGFGHLILKLDIIERSLIYAVPLLFPTKRGIVMSLSVLGETFLNAKLLLVLPHLNITFISST